MRRSTRVLAGAERRVYKVRRGADPARTAVTVVTIAAATTTAPSASSADRNGQAAAADNVEDTAAVTSSWYDRSSCAAATGAVANTACIFRRRRVRHLCPLCQFADPQEGWAAALESAVETNKEQPSTEAVVPWQALDMAIACRGLTMAGLAVPNELLHAAADLPLFSACDLPVGIGRKQLAVQLDPATHFSVCATTTDVLSVGKGTVPGGLADLVAAVALQPEGIAALVIAVAEAATATGSRHIPTEAVFVMCGLLVTGAVQKALPAAAAQALDGTALLQVCDRLWPLLDRVISDGDTSNQAAPYMPGVVARVRADLERLYWQRARALGPAEACAHITAAFILHPTGARSSIVLQRELTTSTSTTTLLQGACCGRLQPWHAFIIDTSLAHPHAFRMMVDGLPLEALTDRLLPALAAVVQPPTDPAAARSAIEVVGRSLLSRAVVLREAWNYAVPTADAVQEFVSIGHTLAALCSRSPGPSGKQSTPHPTTATSPNGHQGQSSEAFTVSTRKELLCRAPRTLGEAGVWGEMVVEAAFEAPSQLGKWLVSALSSPAAAKVPALSTVTDGARQADSTEDTLFRQPFCLPAHIEPLPPSLLEEYVEALEAAAVAGSASPAFATLAPQLRTIAAAVSPPTATSHLRRRALLLTVIGDAQRLEDLVEREMNQNVMLTTASVQLLTDLVRVCPPCGPAYATLMQALTQRLVPPSAPRSRWDDFVTMRNLVRSEHAAGRISGDAQKLLLSTTTHNAARSLLLSFLSVRVVLVALLFGGYYSGNSLEGWLVRRRLRATAAASDKGNAKDRSHSVMYEHRLASLIPTLARAEGHAPRASTTVIDATTDAPRGGAVFDAVVRPGDALVVSREQLGHMTRDASLSIAVASPLYSACPHDALRRLALHFRERIGVAGGLFFLYPIYSPSVQRYLVRSVCNASDTMVVFEASRGVALAAGALVELRRMMGDRAAIVVVVPADEVAALAADLAALQTSENGSHTSHCHWRTMARDHEGSHHQHPKHDVPTPPPSQLPPALPPRSALDVDGTIPVPPTSSQAASSTRSLTRCFWNPRSMDLCAPRGTSAPLPFLL